MFQACRINHTQTRNIQIIIEYTSGFLNIRIISIIKNK